MAAIYPMDNGRTAADLEGVAMGNLKAGLNNILVKENKNRGAN